MIKSHDYISEPKRLPSEVGRDVAELLKYARLKSRENVVNDIKVFIEDIDKNPDPHVMFLIAEWGEGKTSIFEGYLKTLPPDKGKVISIGGGTLMNWARDIARREVLRGCRINGYRFLAAVFCTLWGEKRNEFEKRYGIKLPSPYAYDDAREYVVKVLKSISASSKKFHRLFLFIDEFEEVTGTDVETRRMITSGIVDFLNMKIEEFREQGEFRGLLHLIISLTPPGWSRLEGDRDLVETIGRLKRRVKIRRLPKISKSEFWELINGILKFAYEGRVPELLPFRPPEIMNPLYISSMGNLGAIIRLIHEIFNRAKIESCIKGKVPVLTFKKVFRYLQDIVISVYGGDTPALFSEMWKRIELELKRILGERESSWIDVLIYLITTLSPTSIDNVAKYTNIRHSEIISAIDKFNQIFHKDGRLGAELRTQKCIYRVYRIIEDYDLVRVRLKERMKEALFLREEEDIDTILDGLTFIEVDIRNDMVHSPYLVIPTRDEEEFIGFITELSEFLGISLSKDEALALRNEIWGIIDRGELAYDPNVLFIVSPRLISLLYPSPAVTILDFIKDLRERLEIWRKLIGGFKEEDILGGILSLFTIRGYNVRKGSEYVLTRQHPLVGEVNIRALIRAIPGILSKRFIDELSSTIYGYILGGKPPPHAILIFCEKVNSDIRDMISRSLGTAFNIKVLVITIPRVHMIQLAAITEIFRSLFITEPELMAKFASDPGKLSELFKLSSKVSSINFIKIGDVLKEIGRITNLERKIEEVLNTRGLVIRDITGLEDIIGAYQYVLLYPEERAKIEDALKFAEKIRGFKLFHLKGIFYKDFDNIEKGIREHLGLMEKFGLLHMKNDELLISVSPEERRILRLLELYHRHQQVSQVSKEILVQSFIHVATRPKRILEEYLRVLKWRGRIEEKRGRVIMVNLAELHNRVRGEYEKFCKYIESHKEIIERFGYLCSAKRRACNVINVKEYVEFVKRLMNRAESEISEDVALRTYILVQELISYYFRRNGFGELLERASKESRTLYTSLRRRITDLRKSVVALKQSIHGILGGIIEMEFDEIKSIEGYLIDFESILKRQLDYDEVKESLMREWERLKGRARENFVFFFKKSPSNAYYFNVKFRLLKEKYEDYVRRIDKVHQELKEAESFINEISRLKRSLKSLMRLRVKDTLKISKGIIGLLRPPEIPQPVLKRISSLNDLKNKLNAYKKILEETHSTANKVIRDMHSLIKTEEIIVSKTEDICKYIKIVSQSCIGLDLPERISNSLKSSRETYNEAIRDYQELIEKINALKPIYIHEEENIKKLILDAKNGIKNIEKKLEISKNNINEVIDYLVELLNSYERHLNLLLELYRRIHKAAFNPLTTKSKEDILTRGERILEDLKKARDSIRLCNEEVNIASILKSVRKLIDEVIRELPLDKDDIEIFRIVRDKCSRYSLLGFWEAVEEIAKEMKKNKEFVVNKLFELIKKRVLDVYFR